MGLLKMPAVMIGSLAALLAPGCYSPELADCAVSCTVAADCSPGQACGVDGWCVGDGSACSAPGPDDSGSGGLPAPVQDELRLVIAGQGQVELEILVGDAAIDLAALDRDAVSKQRCSSNSAAGSSCVFPLPPGTRVSMQSKEARSWTFAGWDVPSCGGGAPKICAIQLGAGRSVVTATFQQR
jgi:hypothetical protein